MRQRERHRGDCEEGDPQCQEGSGVSSPREEDADHGATDDGSQLLRSRNARVLQGVQSEPVGDATLPRGHRGHRNHLIGRSRNSVGNRTGERDEDKGLTPEEREIDDGLVGSSRAPHEREPENDADEQQRCGFEPTPGPAHADVKEHWNDCSRQEDAAGEVRLCLAAIGRFRQDRPDRDTQAEGPDRVEQEHPAKTVVLQQPSDDRGCCDRECSHSGHGDTGCKCGLLGWIDIAYEGRNERERCEYGALENPADQQDGEGRGNGADERTHAGHRHGDQQNPSLAVEIGGLAEKRRAHRTDKEVDGDQPAALRRRERLENVGQADRDHAVPQRQRFEHCRHENDSDDHRNGPNPCGTGIAAGCRCG